MFSLWAATAMIGTQSVALNFQLSADRPPELSWLMTLGKTKTEIINLYRAGKLRCKDIIGSAVYADNRSLDFEVDVLELPSDIGYRTLKIDVRLTFDRGASEPGGKVSEILVNSVSSYYTSHHTQGRYSFSSRAHLRHIYPLGPLRTSRMTGTEFEQNVRLNTDGLDSTKTVRKVIDFPYPWTLFAPFGSTHVAKVILSARGPWTVTSTFDPETRSSHLGPIAPYSTSADPFLDSSISSVHVFPLGDLRFSDGADPDSVTWLDGSKRELFELSPGFLKKWQVMFEKSNSTLPDKAAESSQTRRNRRAGSTTKPESKPNSKVIRARPSESWLIILNSSDSSREAQAAKKGLDKTLGASKVAPSSDFRLLKPGIWIVYLGPYPTKSAAESETRGLRSKHISNYVKRGR